MPNIPQITSPGIYPVAPMSPNVMGSVGGTIARSGEQIQQLGEYGERVSNAIEKAKDHVQTLQFTNSLDADLDRALLSFRTRTDFQNFEKDAGDIISGLSDKYQGMVKDNPRLSEVFNLHLQAKSRAFSHAVTAKMIDEMGKEAQVQWETRRDSIAQKMADATTDQERDQIKSVFEAETQTLINSHLLEKQFAYTGLKNLDSKVQDQYKVMADQQIMLNPAQAVLNLLDKDYLPKFQGEARQQKLEKAIAADKIFKGEQERKLKEQQKLVHDDEDRKIGDLFLKEDFKNAYLLAQDSKFLTGDEKRTWKNAIDKRTEEKQEKVDDVVEAAEIVRTNAMIASRTMPDSAIRNHLITTPKLSKTKRDQQIQKFEGRLSHELEDGRKNGYADIIGIIDPKSKGLSVENIIRTPQQTAAIMGAQMALDSWIDSQIRADKSPSRNEVRVRAQQLAGEYQVKFKDKMEYFQNQINQLGELK